jgi:hypothetical protein
MLNPDALAENGDGELDSREGVQEVDEDMLYEFVTVTCKTLPPESARPFASWLYEVWTSFNEDGDKTNRQVIDGALAHWRGYA